MKPECRDVSATTLIHIIDKQPQEHLRTDRKTLKDLQPSAGTDKENLVGGGRILQSTSKESLKPEKEAIGEKKHALNEVLHEKMVVVARKKQKKMKRNVGKEKIKITAEDLTSNDGPSENYWCVLAEKRRVALEEALEENMRLHEKIALLEEENSTQKIILDETNSVLDVLREMVGDVSDASIASDSSNIRDNSDTNDVDQVDLDE